MSGYRVIKDELMRRVRNREWRAGETIPGEVELAAEFGVARATMNRALRELSDDGVLERKRHAGTRVSPAPVRQARLEIPLIRLEIEAAGAQYRHALLLRKLGDAPQWLAARLGLPADAQTLELACLHFADGLPQVHEQRWINLAAVPDAAAADFAAINPNEWLVAAVPFTNAEFSFSAAMLGEDTAPLLDVRAGDASFITERTTWLGATPVTFARMSHRPGYRMVTRI